MSHLLNRRDAITALAAGAAGLGPVISSSQAACCYFAAKDKDINQPAQKAFINWDASRQQESFTVQPKFEGNAEDFGMVVPTPSRPKLDEMPRDLFGSLAVFSILEPMPLDKYKSFRAFSRNFRNSKRGGVRERRKVRVLEEGVVGSLDYKIIKAEDAADLFGWLDDHKYHYGGDRQTLDFYIQKKWIFTVMKIDPKQMKRRPDGSYSGNLTPTRFTFTTDTPIYPLRITQLSVKDKTEALFYVQSDEKMDLPASFSYQSTWQPMWTQAMSFAIKRTEGEKEWLSYVKPKVAEYIRLVKRLRQDGIQPATLEWTKKITKDDLKVIDGQAKYNRDAPAEAVKKLKILRGHVQLGKVITKFRKIFHNREMSDDLTLQVASIDDRKDKTAYYQILPTSPP